MSYYKSYDGFQFVVITIVVIVIKFIVIVVIVKIVIIVIIMLQVDIFNGLSNDLLAREGLVAIGELSMQ